MINDKLKGFFYRFSLGLLSVLLMTLLYKIFTTKPEQADIYEPYGLNTGLFIIPGILLLTMFLCGLFIVLKKINTRKVQFIGIGLFVLIFILQIAYLIYVYIEGIKGRTDAIRCINEAIAMNTDQKGMIDNEVPYFARYGNNYFYTVILYYLCKIIKIFTVDNIDKVLFALNVLIVDLSIFLSVKILWKIKRNSRICVMLLVMFTLSPATYCFVTYFYTNMLSIPFILGALYYGICAVKDSGHNIRNIIIAGILGSFGFCIRATTIIPVIALVISIWIFVKKMKIKLTYTAIILLCFIIMVFSSNSIVKMHITNTSNEANYPFTHWIMMGVKELGYVNDADIAFSNSFDTKEDRLQGEWLEIKNRLNALGPMGYMELLVTKLYEVWGIGTDDYFLLGSRGENLLSVSEYITGDKNLSIVIICFITRGSTVLLALSGTFVTLFRRRKKLAYFNYLALLGAIVFLLIWETNRKYNICFMPLLLLLAVDGIEYTSFFASKKRLANKQKKAIGTSLCVALSACIIAALFMNHNILSKPLTEYSDILINVGAYSDDFEKLNGEGKYITQTFYPSREFNEIVIRASNQEKVTTDSYLFELIAPDGSIIHNKTWPNESTVSSLPIEVIFRFDNVNVLPCDKPYTIKLTNLVKQDRAVSIGHNPLKYYDVYSKGECIKNGKHKLTDMTFRVSKAYTL